jgi:AbrB family looped-hinge helix DNA binding protein
MTIATLTSKGQLTLPRDVRDSLGLAPGDKVDSVVTDGGYKLVPLRQDIRSLKGRLAGRVKRPVTTEEIDNGIAWAASESIDE